MWLSDTSVKRPVFATVISLILVAFGLMAYQNLETREYPDISPARISVSANYPGANAAVVETKVAQILEEAISGIEGIKSIRSSSQDGRASINIEFELNRNIDEAANDVRDKISRVTRRLPEEVEDLTVAKAESDSRALIYLSASSTQMNRIEVADYVDRYIIDRLAALPGVSEVSMFGGGRPAVRIDLDRKALAAQSLTVTDVVEALRSENVELPAGIIESDEREFPVRIARNYQSVEDFQNLVLFRGDDGHLVRLGEVADVTIGPETRRRIALSNGSFQTTAFSVFKQSTANTLTVLQEIYDEVDRIQATLPEHMSIKMSADASAYIRAALNNVYTTIAITVFLVGLVIYLFLCNLRATLIPMITVPVCLISSFIALAVFGYSVNLITLLALVLAIGLVVDDSIVVLENVSRRIQKGEHALLASFRGSRQVAFAVIATTAVLVAVFVPIAFATDNIGQIFAELAITIAAAVIFSSVIALSLAPMLCSKVLADTGRETSFSSWVNRNFNRLTERYEAALNVFITKSWLAPLLMAGGLALGYLLYQLVPQEYAPEQDQGTILASYSSAEGAGRDVMERVIQDIHKPVEPYLEDGTLQRSIMFSPGRGSGTNAGFSAFTLAPYDQRNISTAELRSIFMDSWRQIPDARVFAFSRNGLSRGGGNQPVQFVLQGSNYEELARWRDIMIEGARQSGLFGRFDHDLKETQQQLMIDVNKNRAAELGVSASSIGTTLQSLLSEQTVSTYVRDGEEYDIVMQAKEEQRTSADDLANLYVRSTRTNELIPLSNMMSIESIAGIAQLNRYNRLRSVTLSGNLAAGVSLGEALQFLENHVAENLPEHAQFDYRGESLEYKESSRSMVFIFGIAMLILFLVMAAQFESFIHPLVIMMTVPLGITGGLLGLYLTGNTLNIFSQIGLLMIIGIAAKNGILIVEFINQMRDAGHRFTDAILQGASVRLRPVLMTTMSTLMGSIPLMLASGPGSESLNVLGVVVFSGVLFSSILTLFVIPAFYRILAQNTDSPEAISRKLEALEQNTL